MQKEGKEQKEEKEQKEKKKQKIEKLQYVNKAKATKEHWKLKISRKKLAKKFKIW